MKILTSLIKNECYELMVITSLTGTCCLVSGTAQDRGRRILTSQKRTWDRNCQTGLKASLHLPKPFIQAVILQGIVQDPRFGEPLEPLSLTHSTALEHSINGISLGWVSHGFECKSQDICMWFDIPWGSSWLGDICSWSWTFLFFFSPLEAPACGIMWFCKIFQLQFGKQGFHPGYCRKVILPGLGSSRQELKMPSV